MYGTNPEKIIENISKGKEKICVVGLGYVGIPLAVAFASKNVKVIGYEINTKVVDMINRGISPIYEPGLNDALKRCVENGAFVASNDEEVIASSRFIIITVGTPIDEFYTPKMDYVKSACEKIGRNMNKNSIIVLKSTVPPLTTENIVIPLLEKYSNMKCGKDFGVAFCPERTVEGRAMEEFFTLPKVVGGIDKHTTDVVAGIFSILNEKVIKVSSPRVAEMVKLMDNTYRDVNIALANQFANVCYALGIDVIEAINAANKDYSRNNILKPGAGVGGSCLPKDPFILASTAEKYGEELSLVKIARLINSSMPNRIMMLIHKVISEKKIENPKITILGLAFKSDTNDIRNTPAKIVIENLRNEGFEIVCFDPFVKPEDVSKNLGEIDFRKDMYEACEKSDCIVIMTDHKLFYDIDLLKLKKIMRNRCIVDGRHVIDPHKAIKNGFIYEGIGRPSKYFKLIEGRE